MKKLKRNMWRLIKLAVMKNSQVMVTMKKHKRIMMTSDQNKNLGVIKHLEFMEIQKKNKFE
jgi:chorismate mutase